MTSKDDMMHQTARFPKILADLVSEAHFTRDWHFSLTTVDRGQGSAGLTLIINIHEPDAYNPSHMVSVNHYFPVPPAAYDMRAWRRWLFDCVIQVLHHEAMEGFRIGDDRPYAPSHGPGNDPYMIREVGTLIDQKTSFTGEVNP